MTGKEVKLYLVYTPHCNYSVNLLHLVLHSASKIQCHFQHGNLTVPSVTWAISEILDTASVCSLAVCVLFSHFVPIYAFYTWLLQEKSFKRYFSVYII